MKVIIHSNAPWAGTGYGQQTSMFARLLQEQGHEPGVSAFWGLNGSFLTWQGIPVWPGGIDGYGNDVLLENAVMHFGDPWGGVVLTLVDVWVLDPAILSQTNVVCWVPVDHDPVPWKVVEVLEASGCLPMAMSRFGQGALKDAGLESVYCPHGVDTEMFCIRDKQETRKELNLPESAFIVGMVAANKGFPARKGLVEAIEAFAAFRKAQKDKDAYLVLHTEPLGKLGGVQLHHVLEHLGVPSEAVSISNPNDWMRAYPQDLMAKMYSCMDVFLNPAYGEGFCVPMAEAACSGVPTIATNWTAMPEVGEVGWLVEGQKFWTPQGGYWKIPEVEQIVWALKEAHTSAHRMGDAARAHGLQYDHKTVYAEHLLPALEQCLAGRELVAA